MGAVEGAGNRGASRFPAVHALKAARECGQGGLKAGRFEGIKRLRRKGAGVYGRD